MTVYPEIGEEATRVSDCLIIGIGFKVGKYCDLMATPLNTEFIQGVRRLTPAKKGVFIGEHVTLGDHVVINRGVSRQTRIGNRVFIWHNSVVGHDCVIEDDVCVGVGCVLSGVVEIGPYTYIGAGTTISPRVKIGSYCMIGAGSNILHDTMIPDGEMWVGNPARRIKPNEWRPPT